VGALSDIADSALGFYVTESNMMYRRTALKAAFTFPLASVGALFYTTSQAAGSSGGAWTAPISMPVLPIHVSLLPNGSILFWQHGHEEIEDTTRPGGRVVKDHPDPHLWNLGTSAAQPVNVPEMFGNLHTDEIYCSVMSLLPDGKLFVAGGHQSKWNTPPGVKNDEFTGSNQVLTFNASVVTPWALGPRMISGGRWYPSALPLADGSTLVISGIDHLAGDFVYNAIPEVYDQRSNSFRVLSGAAKSLPTYPWMYRVPNAPSRVFYAGPGSDTAFLEVGGTGRWVSSISSTFPPTRSPGAIHRAASVLYRHGRVMNVGGIDVSTGHDESTAPPSATAEVIDLNQSNPGWSRVASMNFPRQHHSATLLPDGKVLVTGGTTASGNSNPAGAVQAAEMWDPAANTWSVMASGAAPRMHHSVALLLPDARVLVGGGGQTGFGGEVDYSSFEFYSPPYFFTGAPRPVIGPGTPGVLQYGQTFALDTNSVQVSRAVLIRLPCVTHGVNFNQGYAELVLKKSKNSLQATLPNDTTAAPPGHYMLFVVSNRGFPSIAKIVVVST
jgi:hypothetical protein